ncbi:hypothetical protein [Verrucosispora sp. WMMC514]|uniref:hypothetical protein n=1 Tax=Verrucosispora sp. WMMC514 TaxID=3015156 RepID=UPI00248CAF1D|nr:hypothetical protein [Verrucosispora sp. WMMC514]WBB92231.1 hypothetical protein O7597_04215 [Verrucosispora sp. WMMC514]
MTYDLSSTPRTHEPDSPNGGGVREQAHQMGSEAAHAGSAVAETAREQGREVGREAARQARDLYGEARTQLAGQAGEQQRRAAGGLRSLADEMRSMADNGGQAGPVSELARQASDRVHGVAGWLEQREPGDLLTEVRDYARRNPGTFLVGAALLGAVAGRLTRNLSASGDDRPASPATEDLYGDPDRTVALPTQAPPSAGSTGVPAGGNRDPRTQPTDLQPVDEGYSGTGTPLPPVERTDPLPGVPSSGTTRP